MADIIESTVALPVIYVFCNQKNCDGSGTWHEMVAIAEDGTHLAQHVCSNHFYAPHDMGIVESGWKRDLYAKHYPNGFSVKWIEGKELANFAAEVQRTAPKEAK